MEPLKIKLKKLNNSSRVPTKGTPYAACFDAYVNSITFDQKGNAVIGLGFSTEIPVGYKGIIVPRSGFSNYKWVMNNNLGKIDSDYRGEWMMKIKPISGSLSENPLPFAVGDRCCQVYFEKVLDAEFEEVESLNDTQRGEGGFGSTGK
jgi:dUTP pyrophosphatase